MISEHEFAVHFSSFWRSALPNLESVLRTLNLGYDRIARPLKPTTSTHRRDIISETGFRLLGLSVGKRKRPEDLIEEATAEAAKFLTHDRVGLSNDEAAEALELCRRLGSYVQSSGGSVEFMPSFPGHGMMTSCKADLLVGDTIVEVKYVDRAFRSTDLRQLLCYCGLRYLSEKQSFKRVAVFNPLRGIAITIPLVELVDSASGRAPEDFFQDMSYVLSSGEISR